MFKKYLPLILLIVTISLIPGQVFAERIISIEKTVPTESEQLMQVISNFDAYPSIFPENIKSSNIINDEENISKVTFILEGINIDADLKYIELSSNELIILIVSGDLQGTKLKANFTPGQDEQGNDVTIVNAIVDVEISWYLSMLLWFISDENVESALGTGLDQFSRYANNPQPPKVFVEEEDTCFLMWCW